ncbi:transmembrane protein 53-like isoform X2 [Limulus polyphemus]|uniref:Transmembrane protein 53-like isoform X2 n=1 Tax=Limulus polyphemus TaxID=6850 RepID=A0ABM1T2E7_LIMPO|nr:transmembrane protein 53-like isoform X2 [Limulus polyphemus]
MIVRVCLSCRENMKTLQVIRQTKVLFSMCRVRAIKWSHNFTSVGNKPQIRKVLLPCVVFHTVAQVHTNALSKNMKLTRNDSSNESNTPLVVLLAWMMAKDHHLKKYSNIYLERGFDILTVTMSPIQMLLPTSGCHILAQSLLGFLEQEQYEKIIFHGFSVGAYLFGEFLRKLNESSLYLSLISRFKGQIFDSAVGFEGIPKGFPRAVTSNLLLVKFVEFYIRNHLHLMYNIATKHYIEASNAFHNSPLKCPALLLVSADDMVGNPQANQKLMAIWQAQNIDVSWKCWEKSAHVSHFYHHKDEYIEELDKFLKKIQL